MKTILRIFFVLFVGIFVGVTPISVVNIIKYLYVKEKIVGCSNIINTGIYENIDNISIYDNIMPIINDKLFNKTSIKIKGCEIELELKNYKCVNKQNISIYEVCIKNNYLKINDTLYDVTKEDLNNSIINYSQNTELLIYCIINSIILLVGITTFILTICIK